MGNMATFSAAYPLSVSAMLAYGEGIVSLLDTDCGMGFLGKPKQVKAQQVQPSDGLF